MSKKHDDALYIQASAYNAKCTISQENRGVVMSDRIYEDYTDEEIERMEREFDDWFDWSRAQQNARAERLVSSATPQELANAQRNAKIASC